ncbi:LPS export ABC transporter periplasmic protein LptC [Aliidiomarina sp. Khilg15.8]
MNWRIALILSTLAVVLVLLFWRPFADKEEDQPLLDTEQLQPDFIAEGLFTRIFSAEGDLQHRIESTRMAHYSVIGLTELTQPTYRSTITLSNGSTEQWHVRADKGSYFDDDRLLLEDNVRITNEDGRSYIQAIETDSLTIDTLTQVISTDDMVLIYGPQFEVSGQGMRANLESQQLELSQHVQTIYYPQRSLQ